MAISSLSSHVSSLLLSVQATLTAVLPLGQPGNGICLLFLRQTLTLTYYMIYCFTLLATQTTKRGVHGLVPVELNIACFQCLFLGCKSQFCSFNFQVTFPIPLRGLIFVNCLRHFPCKLTMHFSLSIYSRRHFVCPL